LKVINERGSRAVFQIVGVQIKRKYRCWQTSTQVISIAKLTRIKKEVTFRMHAMPLSNALVVLSIARLNIARQHLNV
jgi:hypothetical protein